MPITIKVNRNGPYVIQEADIPNVTLVDHDGNVIPTAGRKKISLCRCGASTTKPFCDGTHSRIGFIGAEVAREEFDKSGAATSSGASPAAGATEGT
jgi:3-phenylpropionate/trans-cinnamate dioxygenase ferredoxin subunit